ncbi:hypothetical protein NUM_43290 [Actinocatenispora comari]|uniref:MinD-like ATPase involved in chromosome partitioning or flagellar assembly n=1 Tax=Actinocatenispora comari TaxID=2807577 RepID=A0A8J4AGD9_9ACTN|nr:hypothetical protein NUM_43290 [Actinocatenispora comari]
MSVVVFCRAKAGGCVTATALAVTACWPDPGPVTVVEADASGGSLAARAGLEAGPGLVEWAAMAGSPRPAGELLDQVSRPFPGTSVAVVTGPVDGAEQPQDSAATAYPAAGGARLAGGAAARARAAVTALACEPRLLEAGDDRAVLLDAGQVSAAAPAWPLLARADGVLVCAPPSLDGLAAAFGLAREIQAAPGCTAEVALVAIGDGPYSPQEITAAAPAALWGVLPHDPHAADLLGSGRGLAARTRLARAATVLAARCAKRASASPFPAPGPARDATADAQPSRLVRRAPGRRWTRHDGVTEPPAHLALFDRSRMLPHATD